MAITKQTVRKSTRGKTSGPLSRLARSQQAIASIPADTEQVQGAEAFLCLYTVSLHEIETKDNEKHGGKVIHFPWNVVEPAKPELCLSEFDLLAWRELFHQAYHVSPLPVMSHDLERCPEIYEPMVDAIRKEEDPDYKVLSQSEFDAAPICGTATPYVSFNEETGHLESRVVLMRSYGPVPPPPKGMKSMSFPMPWVETRIWTLPIKEGDYDMTRFYNILPTVDTSDSSGDDHASLGKPIEEATTSDFEPDSGVTVWVFDRRHTLHSMRRQIRWEDIESVHAFIPHITSDEWHAPWDADRPETWHRLAYMISKLRDGRYMLTVSHIHWSSTEYPVGAIVTAGTVRELLELDLSNIMFRGMAP